MRRAKLRGTLRWSLITTLTVASLLAGAETATAGRNWTRAATGSVERAGQRPWSVYSVKIDGVKHFLGVTQNAPPKVRAKIRRQVASDPVSQAGLRTAAKRRGVGKTGRVVRDQCSSECAYMISYAFDYPGGCGDVILTISSFGPGWYGDFNTWSHWCAMGTTIGYAPSLYVSQTNTYNAVPIGTNNHINQFFYNYYGHGPYSGFHVRGEGHWIACQGDLCQYWLAKIEHYMHYDGTEYFHMYPAAVYI
jgi:hypothetical protein